MAVKRYNGTNWEVKAGDQNITYAATAPTAPSVGDVWVSTQDIVSFDNTVQTGNRNVLINGAMDIWQRGAPTTASPTAIGAAHAYTADRWNVYRAGLITGSSWSQQSTAADLPLDFRYALRVQRVSGDTSTASVVCVQGVETSNAWKLRGKTVSVSFYARAGANYSAASGLLAVRVVTGTGVDETPRGGMTSQTNDLNSTATLTTSWQRFTYTAVISNNMSSLAFLLSSTPVGTAGANDWFEITGVQLELGSTATPFENRPIGLELELCQRYYVNKRTDFATINGFTTSNAQKWLSTSLPTTMRAAPNFTPFDGLGNAGRCSTLDIGGTVTHNVIPSFQTSYSTLVTVLFTGTNSGLYFGYVAEIEL
jgi:hypothetical protein